LQKNKALGAALAVLIIAGAGTAIYLANQPDAHTVEASVRVEKPVTAEEPAPAPASDPDSIIIRRGEEVGEIQYLPDNVEIATGQSHAMTAGNKIPQGSRRITGIRKVSDPSINGPFLAPRMSPDGMQMLAIRPGYQGVFLLGMNGGAPIPIHEGGVRDARWTADGRIEVQGEDGLVRTFGPDGTLESTRPHTAENERVYSENDVIFARADDGAAPMPLTSDDDRYFNPVLSPDEQHLVYQGLYSGLYMSSPDGSGEPVYLGPGNNPVWLPDGSGVIFDRTADDGHHLTEGDLVFVSSDLSEISVLTDGSDLIEQMPSVSPDGGTVVFESDGGIYAGSFR
jgi:hypothetical protein